MNTASRPLRLLMIGGSADDAENLLTLFRDAGGEVSSEHIESHEEITLALARGPYALALAMPLAGEFPVAQIGAALGSQQPWVAVLAAPHDTDTTLAALQAGAITCLDPGQPQALRLSACHLIARLTQAPVAGDNAAVEAGEDALAFFSDGMVLNANQAFTDLLGYASPDDLDCLPVIDLIAEQDKDKFKAFLKTLGSRPSELGISLMRADGEEFLVPMTLSAATHDGEVCRQMLIRQDDTSGEGSGLSMNDPVTGLINRQFFLDHLGAALVQAANVTTVEHVLFVCIDQFEQLVGKYGLPGADAILADLAALVRPVTEKRHYLSRYGDNSLALMLPDSDADQARAFGESLCGRVAEHICEINKQTVQYTISIGITVLNAKSPRDPVELLDQCRQAVTELRTAAGGGTGNGVQLFARSNKPVVNADGQEVIDLDEAIDQGRMRLAFQPLLSIKGDPGDHYEAFVRMLDSNDELIGPGRFLDQLNPKLGVKLDRWVILEGIKHLSAQCGKGKDVRLIVNLSAYALEDSGLAGWLKVAMQAGDVPPKAMIFQLSESEFTRNINQGRQFAEQIKDIGCSLSLSHFGEGANDPVTVLKHLAVDYVKISPKYTLALQDGSGDPQPLKTLVSCITEGAKRAVVPNVENASVLAILWQAGANFIQGNYLQPPQPEMNYEFSEIA